VGDGAREPGGSTASKETLRTGPRVYGPGVDLGHF